MKCTVTHNRCAFRFHRWSRKRYAVFMSLGRQVTIAGLHATVADVLLPQQHLRKRTLSHYLSDASLAGEFQEELPDERLDLLALCGLLADDANPGASSFDRQSLIIIIFIDNGSVFLEKGVGRAFYLGAL